MSSNQSDDKTVKVVSAGQTVLSELSKGLSDRFNIGLSAGIAMWGVVSALLDDPERFVDEPRWLVVGSACLTVVVWLLFIVVVSAVIDLAVLSVRNVFANRRSEGKS